MDEWLFPKSAMEGNAGENLASAECRQAHLSGRSQSAGDRRVILREMIHHRINLHRHQ
jgi:hypothetical protein